MNILAMSDGAWLAVGIGAVLAWAALSIGYELFWAFLRAVAEALRVENG